MRQTALLFFIAAAFAGCAPKGTDLTGKWMDQKRDGKGFVLKKDGFASFVNGNKEDEETFVKDGVEMQMKYKLDESKSPAWFDFVFIEKATGKEHGFMSGTIKIIDKDNIELMLGYVFFRPTEFDKKDNGYARLKRVE